MKSLFLNMFQRFTSRLKQLFTSKEMRKALDLGLMLADLLPYANQAVMLVAAVTKNRTAQSVKRLFDQLQLDPGIDLNRPLSDLEINSLLTAAARFAARKELEKAIEAAGGAGILVAGTYVKKATEIPDRVVDTAVQNAYLLLREIVDFKLPATDQASAAPRA